MLRSSLIIIIALFSAAVTAQTTLRKSSDTIVPMAPTDYFNMVVQRHPVVRQAQLLSVAAKAEIRLAKGMLDPKATVNYNGKTFSGTDYYQLWDNTLTVPTWVGVDVKAGVERNTGQYVNPEVATPNGGLWYLGVSVPLGQGLFIDERRNAIKQAQLMPSLAEAERVGIINKLVLQAARDYWDWYFQYSRYIQFEEGYRLAADRFQAVKARALLGDLPTIDTVEALIAVQDRDNARRQAYADYQAAMWMAGVHLWRDDTTPYELTESIVPQLPANIIAPITLAQVRQLSDSAQLYHPDLVKIDVKQEQLQIEERYQRDKLKPKLYANYNILTRTVADFSEAGDYDYFSNNYKMGVSFSYPLLLRETRGKIRLVEVKQEQLVLERQNQERFIRASIEGNYQNWIALEEQIKIQEQQVVNARLLRDAEQTRFFAGESSFFLVNTREVALINAQIKLAELYAKYAKVKAELYWSAGQMPVQ